MKKISKMVGMCLFMLGTLMGANLAQAYEHEVWQSGGRYYWKTYNVERGNSSDLATAIHGCMGSGNRLIHITTGGTLNGTIRIPGSNTRIDGHNHTFTKNHGDLGIDNRHNGFELYNFNLTGGTSQHGIRSTGASNLRFVNVSVKNSPWIGIRIDSRSSEAWLAWISNLYMENITTENCGSHGVETYSINGVEMYGMVAKNCGDCGVLNNRCDNIKIGTVDAYRCAVNNHYAGYRQANDCGYSRIDNIKSIECGRGIYIMGNSRDTEINWVDVRGCYYRGITSGDLGSNRLRIHSGTCTDNANVNVDIWDPTNVCIRVNGTTYGNACSSGVPTGWVRIRNRGTGMYIDGYGRTSNGSEAAQYANTTSYNAQWTFTSAGSGYYYIVNRGTGMKLDGYGVTTNGEKLRQYSNSTTSANAQWKVEQTGSYYYIINRGTGKKIDGYGLTTNGWACRQYSPTTHVNAQWTIQ